MRHKSRSHCVQFVRCSRSTCLDTWLQCVQKVAVCVWERCAGEDGRVLCTGGFSEVVVLIVVKLIATWCSLRPVDVMPLRV